MEHKNIEVNIVPRYDLGAIELWVYERYNGLIVNYSTDEGKLTTNEIEPYNTLAGQSPLLRLPLNVGAAVFEAIVNHNAKQGHKSDNENLLQGKLQATTDHLNDMREMAKQLLNNQIKKK